MSKFIVADDIYADASREELKYYLEITDAVIDGNERMNSYGYDENISKAKDILNIYYRYDDETFKEIIMDEYNISEYDAECIVEYAEDDDDEAYVITNIAYVISNIEYDYYMIRGCCQGDWNYLYIKSENGVFRREIESCYFNLGKVVFCDDCIVGYIPKSYQLEKEIIAEVKEMVEYEDGDEIVIE